MDSQPAQDAGLDVEFAFLRTVVAKWARKSAAISCCDASVASNAWCLMFDMIPAEAALLGLAASKAIGRGHCALPEASIAPVMQIEGRIMVQLARFLIVR